MSKPVTRREVGKKLLKSSVFSGQPRDPNGQRLDENHVSKTSSSCLRSIASSL